MCRIIVRMRSDRLLIFKFHRPYDADRHSLIFKVFLSISHVLQNTCKSCRALIQHVQQLGKWRKLQQQMGGITWKGPPCPESVSYQKKDGRAWPRPSFCRCHTKRRVGVAMRAHPFFGMTTTKAIRDLFVWRRPNMFLSRERNLEEIHTNFPWRVLALTVYSWTYRLFLVSFLQIIFFHEKVQI